MGVLQGLASYDGRLYAAWKGEVEDDRIFYSEYNGQYWTEQDLAGGNTSAGPSMAVVGDRLYLAWKGEHSDERVFFLTVTGGLWSNQAQIPGVASSTGPALAEFDGQLYAAWKGMSTDQGLWYARFDGANWSGQNLIPGVASAVGPSLASFDGRLYAVWRGMNNDQGLWFASFDGNTWSGQAQIAGVASSVGPSLATYRGRLYAAWKGVTGDEALWYSSFDGAAWAPQQTIPGVGSSVGPALAVHNDLLYAMWKGADDDQGLYYASYDTEAWSAQQRIPGNTGQDTPQNIGLRMQFQETSQWCWLAVAASIAHFYGATEWITQCNLMTTIGQSINKWPNTTICCPTGDMITAHPEIVGEMLDPYQRNAEQCLENVGIPQVCIKSGGVGDALNVNGNNNGWHTGLTLDQVAAEVNAGRPVAVDITWNSGGGHVVAIAGILNDQILVCDPANGESVIAFEDFPAGYYGGAVLDGFTFTKAS